MPTRADIVPTPSAWVEATMIRSARIIAVAVALAFGVTACPAAYSRYSGGAEFIFTGTTLIPRASTIDAEDVAELAIVRVDEIMASHPVFAGLTGTDVTVRLRDPARAREGDRRVYFTNGWHWGDGIGVIELSSVSRPSDASMPAMRSDIERARQEQSDEDLRARLRSAELVVAGRVSAVRPSSIPRLPTEHDPEWREADIEVAVVLKGNADTRRVTILFPGTDDPMWYRAPRFAENAEGVWLLHRQEWARQRLPHLTAPQLEDFRPRAEEARVRRLLQR